MMEDKRAKERESAVAAESVHAAAGRLPRSWRRGQGQAFLRDGGPRRGLELLRVGGGRGEASKLRTAARRASPPPHACRIFERGASQRSQPRLARIRSGAPDLTFSGPDSPARRRRRPVLRRIHQITFEQHSGPCVARLSLRLRHEGEWLRATSRFGLRKSRSSPPEGRGCYALAVVVGVGPCWTAGRQGTLAGQEASRAAGQQAAPPAQRRADERIASFATSRFPLATTTRRGRAAPLSNPDNLRGRPSRTLSRIVLHSSIPHRWLAGWLAGWLADWSAGRPTCIGSACYICPGAAPRWPARGTGLRERRRGGAVRTPSLLDLRASDGPAPYY
ncbi:uncharacterized protein PSFLO_00772 [Pseudozyma flocculosa]|uniref:Uncharacterized protein n=1 Tax=Pseudozyma flocculosa TaxID=84751 RepID=A0A5C3EW20_9BASI|nr:uncharacterized protein PSFLO_00772 [Pseudozyma flocculosa]